MPLLTTFTVKKLEPFQRPEDAVTQNVKFGNSLTLAAGTVLGRKTSDNKWYAYASGNADGTQTARGLLMYDIATDASGNAFMGSAAVSEFGQSDLTAPIYVGGIFAGADLTGMDATALASLNASLIFGDDLADTNAVIRF